MMAYGGGKTRMGGSSGATRYVFAASSSAEDDARYKTCPRCGEVLFSDMDVCFGCLYDFKRDELSRVPKRRELTVVQGRGKGVGSLPTPTSPDPLEDIELDEIDDDDDEVFPVEPPEPDGNANPVPPRHSKEQTWSAVDTIDLAAMPLVQGGSGDAGATAVKPPRFRVVARSSDMQVRVPLPRQGLAVGRGESNDIILFSHAVSRSHLRLVPHDGAVLAQDMGATNPTEVDGRPLEGSLRLVGGETLDVCGTVLRIEDEPPDPAA